MEDEECKMTKQTIVNMAVGKPLKYTWNDRIEHSGIGKSSVLTAELKTLGFLGDGVANHEYHGGADRAVCLYPFEHYDYWRAKFNTKINPPAFGENITVSGMMEKDICIGDIFSIGSSVLQVTQGRIPCSTISTFNHQEQFLNQLFETGFTGYFFRVLEEGIIERESKIETLVKDPHQVSVLYANQILFHDQDNRAGVEKVLAVEALADVWRKKLIKLL